jgi:NTP pyrophosphatase (non-canonical NTP hydrolase)
VKLNEYQELAAETDQFPEEDDETASHPTDLSRARLVPLLGLVGEVGSVLVEYKKLVQAGPIHSRFREQLAEELGDMLWYLAAVATKAGLKLEDIAQQNLDKTRDRWTIPRRRILHDADRPEDQQLPRTFAYRFSNELVDGRMKLRVRDVIDGSASGNPLTDNSYEDDGYRYHDVMHLAFAASLGWSPVYRKMLKDAGKIRKRFSDLPGEPGRIKEDTEDGGRAQVIEEGIVAAAYVYYSQNAGTETIGWLLLRHIKDLVGSTKIEVHERTEAEWELALLRGFRVWSLLREHGGGIVRGDLNTGELVFEEDHEATSNS